MENILDNYLCACYREQKLEHIVRGRLCVKFQHIVIVIVSNVELLLLCTLLRI